MQNLRDKLLKAGLVSEEQAKRADAPQAPRRAAPPTSSSPAREGGTGARREGSGAGARREGPARPPPGRGGPPRAPAAEPPIPKLPPLPGSKAAQRLEAQKQLELDRGLRELVLGGQVPLESGATVFYFMTRKGKLRRLELSEAQARQLESGELAVVERPEPAQIEHSLVPAAVAERMHALSPRSVRFLNRPGDPIGFMKEEELQAHQASEAASPPEGGAPEAGAPEGGGEGGGSAP